MIDTLIQIGDLVFLYENTFLQHPRKFQMHWLGPYMIRFVTKEGVIQLEKLNRELLEGLVNDNWMKLYRYSHASTH